ncbi:YceD family protein [Brackiella oedipodis]|uniref:YceD family protein n=1 Tax=Brackiella oedipodis TaxID=124225 RepID=UPI000688064A|nr:YceD family protein [Brackiella oedipodis]
MTCDLGKSVPNTVEDHTQVIRQLYLSNVYDFIRKGQSISGQAPLATFERVMTSLADDMLEWLADHSPEAGNSAQGVTQRPQGSTALSSSAHHDKPNLSSLSQAKQALVASVLEQNKSQLVQWQLQPELAHSEQYFLHFHVQANVVLLCQRCLKPFIFEVDSRATVQPVNSEQAFDDLDESGFIDEQAYDKLLANPKLDVAHLLEDEILLSLPYIPRHENESCIDMTAYAPQKDPSPFAILEKLKKES